MLGNFSFDQKQYSISLVKSSKAIATWHKLKVGILAFTELQCGNK